jgi:hypothetical protein
VNFLTLQHVESTNGIDLIILQFRVGVVFAGYFFVLGEELGLVVWHFHGHQISYREVGHGLGWVLEEVEFWL